MSKDLLVLADEYAAATATFARSLALKDGTDSMSPIARDAGDKRAALAEALAALDTAQPVQVNAMLVEAAEYLSNIVLTHMTDYPLETEARVSEWNHHQEAITAAKQAQPVCGYDDTTGNCTRVNCCKQAQPERAPMTEYEKMDLVTNWFSEDWSIKKAVALLEDYEARHGIKQGGQHD